MKTQRLCFSGIKNNDPSQNKYTKNLILETVFRIIDFVLGWLKMK